MGTDGTDPNSDNAPKATKGGGPLKPHFGLSGDFPGFAPNESAQIKASSH
jgi:hypothetical protein